MKIWNAMRMSYLVKIKTHHFNVNNTITNSIRTLMPLIKTRIMISHFIIHKPKDRTTIISMKAKSNRKKICLK